MLHFAPTEEQEEIRQLARSLAVEQLRPHGRDAEKRGHVPPDVARTIAQTGLTTPFPEQYGGSGPIEAVTYTLIAEELGFGDGGMAMNIIGSMMGPLTVMLAGNEDQQVHYVPVFTDDLKGYLIHGSLAFAERTGGYALADIHTTARKQGDFYIVNGSKRDVIHGGESRPRVVLLREEGSHGLEGLSALLVPEHYAGMHIQADMHKLGLNAAPSDAYSFENVAVPAQDMLGASGTSGVIRAATLYMILRAGVACGMARAALEYASAYAKERIAFGRPIVSYQSIAFMIAEMAMKLDAARLLTWRAATDWDQDIDSETLVQEAESAQYQAIKIAKSATTDAVQIMGGAGFIADHPAEMWMRNAAAME
jgi:alkylation response protein AidB-like acyl-CoA dehydrogenase